MALREDKELKIGERVDLFLGRGPSYRTVVDDILNDGTLVVTVPSYRGIPIIVRREQELQLFFYRSTGRYAIDARVDDFTVADELRMIRLIPLSLPQKQQRRESFRLSIDLKVIIRPMMLGPFPEKPDPEEEDEMEYVFARDISATGVALKTRREYSVGERFYLRLYLDWPVKDAEPLDILCQVMRAGFHDREKDIKLVGAMYIDASNETATLITRYVMTREQEHVKKLKLLDLDDEDE